jgi:hypothetical protein
MIQANDFLLYLVRHVLYPAYVIAICSLPCPCDVHMDSGAILRLALQRSARCSGFLVLHFT